MFLGTARSHLLGALQVLDHPSADGTSGSCSLHVTSGFQNRYNNVWSLVSCLGLGLCIGPAVVGPGMASPWFLVERVKGHDGEARMVYGPPDKIWSFRAWSPQMVWLSLTPRGYGHPYFIDAYEIWHNKVQLEDSFGKMTPRPPETLASVCGLAPSSGLETVGSGLEAEGSVGRGRGSGSRGVVSLRESFRIKSRTSCCLWWHLSAPESRSRAAPLMLSSTWKRRSRRPPWICLSSLMN